jgi:hypothetical protein
MKRANVAVAIAAVAALATPAVSAAPAGSAAKKRTQLERQLQAAKAATARYHSVKRAQRDGYVRPPGPISETCVSSPAGGMGVHFENPKLMQDDRINIRRPEMLLYAPDKRGKLRLVGVEYFKNDADQNMQTTDDRPSVFGRPLEGPFEGHHPAMGIHYDLHVWLHRSNPSGRFAPFNPRVKCPS